MNPTDPPTENPGFGSGHLFLADARLALAALNALRYWALRRFFGISRGQANALSVVLALLAADAGATVLGRFIRAPLRITGTDIATGGFIVREAGRGIAGARRRDLPLFGTLVIVAGVGAVALPGIRQAIRSFRAAEQRLRQQRLGRYAASRGAHK